MVLRPRNRRARFRSLNIKYPRANSVRTILGIVAGFLLAIGAAYVHDYRLSQASQTQIVNWDVLGNVVRDETVAIRRFWDDTIGKPKPA